MPRKELILVGGPNGSGKTTFIRKFQQSYPYPYLGADEIAAELSRTMWPALRSKPAASFCCGWTNVCSARSRSSSNRLVG